MKQTSNSRRSRGRGNGKRQGNRNSNYDSGGPDGRIRGNASQVHEKYLTLARDALAADDRISSENYFQHAEHFYRILHANADGQKDSTKDGDTNQKDRDRNRRNRNRGNAGITTAINNRMPVAKTNLQKRHHRKKSLKYSLKLPILLKSKLKQQQRRL